MGLEVRTQALTMPALGLGTWQMEEAEAAEAVADALALGYRHIDTAEIYGNERGVGEGLRHGGVPRESIFVTTKVWRDHLDEGGIRRAVEASLRRLGLDFVDLYLVHWPNPAFDLDETLSAMTKVHEEGLARHIGVSNFPPSWLTRAVERAPIAVLQCEYHPFLDQDALLSLCRTHDLAFTAYSPLAQGRVVGDGRLARIGARHGKTAAQVALRWLVQQPGVSAIPKASRRAHRQANLEIFDFELSSDEMAAITALTAEEARTVDPPWQVDWER